MSESPAVPPLATEQPEELYKYEKWDRAKCEAPDVRCKVVVLGEPNVGKTSLLMRFVQRMYRSDTSSTIGVEYSKSDLMIGNRHTEVQMWDTAGQEKFAPLTGSYITGANVALIVFDLTKAETLLGLQTLRDKVRKYSPGCVCVLVGNKLDLFERQLHDPEIAKINFGERAAVLQCEVGYFAVSALSGAGIDRAVVKAITLAINKSDRNKERLARLENGGAAEGEPQPLQLDGRGKAAPAPKERCCEL